MEKIQALDLEKSNLHNAGQIALKLGFTLILLAYFLVWLPQSVVGLSFIGLELGEWVKFLPQIRSGELSLDRNLFYFPPVILSLMMIAWTFSWSNRRWQTWATRIVAILIACLSFPAIEAITDEPSDQWLFRLQLIVLVIIAAILCPLLKRLFSSFIGPLTWLTIILLALIGASLPTWAFLMIRPLAAELFGVPVGTGPGVILNIVGYLLVLVAAITLLIFTLDDHGSRT